MYIRTSGPDVTAIEVTCYPWSGGHAVSVEFTGRAEIVLHTLDEADLLIIAAANAKRRLEAVIAGTAHEFRNAPDVRGHCDACGLLRPAAIHVAPAPDAAHCPDCGELAFRCQCESGEDVTDSVAEGHDADLAAAVLAGSVASGTPVIITDDVAEADGRNHYLRPCDTAGCGHPERDHVYGQERGIVTGRCAIALCTCLAFVAPAPVSVAP